MNIKKMLGIEKDASAASQREKYPIPEVPMCDKGDMAFYEAIAGMSIERVVRGQQQKEAAQTEGTDFDFDRYQEVLGSFKQKNVAINEKIRLGLMDINEQVIEKEKILEMAWPYMVEWRKFYKKISADLNLLYQLRDSFKKAQMTDENGPATTETKKK
jgi:hypothetical protein